MSKAEFMERYGRARHNIREAIEHHKSIQLELDALNDRIQAGEVDLRAKADDLHEKLKEAFRAKIEAIGIFYALN